MAMDRLTHLALMERALLIAMKGYKLKARPHTQDCHFHQRRLEMHLASIEWEREEIYGGVLNHI